MTRLYRERLKVFRFAFIHYLREQVLSFCIYQLDLRSRAKKVAFSPIFDFASFRH